MFDFFKNKNNLNKKDISISSITSLLIHAAKIDLNYTDKEKKIIKETIISLGCNNANIDTIIKYYTEERKIIKFNL